MFTMKNREGLSPHRVRHALPRALALGLILAAVTTSASAQRYKTIAPKMELKASKALKGKASSSMRNQSAFGAGGKEILDRYYKTYYFPVMTQTTPVALAGLGKKREDLMKQLRGSLVPAAQDHLAKLTMGVMRVLARDNYHPAVRYNATLILGMLDKKYAANGSPPIALPAGTNELLELLEKNEFNGVKVHPSVKVGAMEGLERHVRFGLEAKYADRVTQAAMAMLSQKPSALDVDADVNNWIKCQAASVLTKQFKDGPNAEVHAALTKLIADEKMSLEDRCCVVGLLAKVKYNAAAGVDVASTLAPLGQLTLAVVDEGAEKAEAFVELRRGNAPLGRRVSSRRGEEGPKFERRELLARMISIAKGAKSLSNGLPDEEKQKVQDLLGLLQPVVAVSRDKKALDLDVTSEVIRLNRAIKTVIADWQPAKAVAADAEDADFTE